MKKILKGIKQFWLNLGDSRAERLRKCKPVIAVACVAFAFIMLLGSTLAWFTSSDSITNPFLGSPEKDFSVQVVDVFDRDNPWDHKNVGAVNTGEKPGFVRLLVIPTLIVPANSNVSGSKPTVLPAKFGEHVLIDDLNTTDWMLGEDGYYYYLHVLAVGETTNTGTPNKNLFNKVTASASLAAALIDPASPYYQAQLHIEVKCEAVYIAKWDYRVAWWKDSNTDPASAFPAAKPNLIHIDEALAGLAK